MEARTLAALCVVLVAAVAFAWHHFVAGRPEAVAVTDDRAVSSPGTEPRPPEPSAASATGETAPGEAVAGGTAAGTLVVDVAGEVADPGIYTLPAGSRVADAIEAAGGAEPGADTDGLNRARLLLDGEQILVGAPGPSAAPGGAHPAAGPTGNQPIGLNSATAEQLQTLPGIGPVLAERIVAHRQQHGGFTSVDQLGDVSGIGERRLAELRDRVTL